MTRRRRNHRAEADRIFARLIRETGQCRRCGSTDHLQCAHILSRSYSATRTDERNALCLCRSCHMFFTHRPLEWDLWARQEIGSSVVDALRTLALTHVAPDWKAEVARLEHLSLIGLPTTKHP
jgi:transcription elongation factor Elf1